MVWVLSIRQKQCTTDAFHMQLRNLIIITNSLLDYLLIKGNYFFLLIIRLCHLKLSIVDFFSHLF